MRKRRSASVLRSPLSKRLRTNESRITSSSTSSSSNNNNEQNSRQSRQSSRHRQPQQQQQQQQQLVRRHRHRSCVCLAENYTPVQFPAIWSELRSSQQLCDGTIRCGEESSRVTFPVHRAILSAVSPYFRALFTSTLNPAGKPEAIRELSISDAPVDVFGLILDYAYTGSCQVNDDNVQQLLPLADRLQVLGVVQLCCKFLLNELRPDNCLGIYKFARHYFCRDLEEKGRKFIRTNFKDIFQKSSEFKDLTFSELEHILRDDDLNARTEDLVFEAVKTWVLSEPEKRAAYVPKLLTCVRYGLMRPRYFYENIVTWELAQSEECKNALKPVVEYFEDRTTFPESNLQLDDDEMSRPRVPYEILFAVGGWTYGAPTNFIETYDTRADRWFNSSHLDTTARAYHGMCSLNNQIYIIGGHLGWKYFNTVRCFDPATKEWHEKACMYHARSYVSVCVYGGKIYALGGNNGYFRLSSCERYDPVTNQWEMIADMNWPRSDAGADALNGRIYIAGGFDGMNILQSFEVYDIESGQWSYLMPMHVPRSGLSLVAFKDCLYAIGGFDGFERFSSCEMYDPNQEDEWQEVTEMFNQRSNFATAVLDDMIFVIGGYDDITPVACVECYDAETNDWYEASPMNLGRSALRACVVSGLDNAREYSYHRDYPELWPKHRRKQKRFRRIS